MNFLISIIIGVTRRPHLESVGLGVEKYDEIYLSEDMTRTIQIWCLLNHIKYTIFEVKGDCKACIDNDKTIFRLCTELLQNEDNPIKKIVSTERVDTFPFSDKWEFFDYREAFYELNEKDKNAFLDIFSLGIELPAAFNLYCSDSMFWVRNFCGVYWDEAYSVAELLLDYCFSKEPVVVKPHPKSDQDFYYEYDLVTKIPNSVPVDVLEFIPQISIQKIINGVSSSGRSLKNKAQEIITIDGDYRKFAPFFCRAFYAIEIVKELIKETDKELIIHHIGLKESFINVITQMECVRDSKIKFVKLNESNRNESKIIFVGSKKGLRQGDNHQWLLNIEKKIALFFVMENHEIIIDLLLENEGLINRMEPLLIEKEPFRDNINANLKTDVLWFISSSKDTREQIINFKKKKHLPYSGINTMIKRPNGLDGKVIYTEIKTWLLEKKLKLLDSTSDS